MRLGRLVLLLCVKRKDGQSWVMSNLPVEAPGNVCVIGERGKMMIILCCRLICRQNDIVWKKTVDFSVVFLEPYVFTMDSKSLTATFYEEFTPSMVSCVAS